MVNQHEPVCVNEQFLFDHLQGLNMKMLIYDLNI